ncbi:MAG: DNA polymerase III subunit beta [Desulfobacterales bacterium SG8_35]|nr:MAG: DNA polymerase III subunit beta [Desulfobacterales bacterium SG8_35]
MALSINVSKEDFLPVLNSLQSITGKKGTMAVLANVLIQTQENFIEVIATDLEVGIKKNVAAEIISAGSITLPAKILFEIVRESGSDSIKIQEKDKNWARIKAGSSMYNLAGTSSGEFPDFPEYDEEALVSLPCDLVKELIEKTIFSVAQERESNYTLTGILLEKEKNEEDKSFLRMVSSDGHRLSIMEKELDTESYDIVIEKNTLIPRKGVSEIKKVCDGQKNFSIASDKKQLVVKTKNSLMIVRLMNGEFPDYRSIVNVIEKNNFLEIERIGFLESLKRTNLFTEDTFNAIQLTVDENKLVLSSQNMDFGNAKDEMEIIYSGEPLDLGFNCRYFIDTLQVMRSDRIKAYVNSDQSPCLIEGDEDMGFISIIMPMKI